MLLAHGVDVRLNHGFGEATLSVAFSARTFKREKRKKQIEGQKQPQKGARALRTYESREHFHSAKGDPFARKERLRDGHSVRTAIRKNGYTHIVRNAVRKLVALALSALLLLGGSGFGGAVASEVQHALGMEADSVPAEEGQQGAGCDHCCACHFSSHLVTVTEGRPRQTIVTLLGVPARVAEILTIGASFNFLFRPPRFSLA